MQGNSNFGPGTHDTVNNSGVVSMQNGTTSVSTNSGSINITTNVSNNFSNSTYNRNQQNYSRNYAWNLNDIKTVYPVFSAMATLPTTRLITTFADGH